MEQVSLLVSFHGAHALSLSDTATLGDLGEALVARTGTDLATQKLLWVRELAHLALYKSWPTGLRR